MRDPLHLCRRQLTRAWLALSTRRRFRVALGYGPGSVSALGSHSPHAPGDISDHLHAVFYHAVEGMPRLVIELGTRGGREHSMPPLCRERLRRQGPEC